jgi:hypothetical protein
VTIHPLAQLFPLLEGHAFEEFCQDIKLHGQLEPITVQGGMVLDGRNRMRACDRLGRPVRQVQWDTLGLSISPEAFIWSKNVQRRHLSDGQRAAIAETWRPQLEAEAIRAMVAGGGDKKSEEAKKSGMTERSYPIAPKPTTRKQLAVLADVSERKIQQAATVARDAPELLEEVKAGKISLLEAVKQAEAKPQPQKHAEVSVRPMRVIDVKAAKRRVIAFLSSIEGSCDGLGRVRIDLILSAFPEDELEQWAAKAAELSNRLRSFGRKLRNTNNGEIVNGSDGAI